MKNLKQLLALLLIISASLIFAQEKPIEGDLSQFIPIDSKVKIGKLENGLTYYIRKNSRPENKIEFRLVVNAGSILENDDQQGLAHFIEHMAFNGTENFEKNDLINYLQSIGVEFGADLNAYTSFDETVYMLPIPTENEKLVNEGLQVLRDWAGGLTFDPEEIDKERGVVVEEWRLGQGADQRMREEWFPVLFKDSKYANRLPIGTKEIIEGASYETIKQYYKDWYRPNLMAIVAVGDLEPEAMEAEIKKRFGDLKNPKKERKRENMEVPSHEETNVSVVTDKEASFTQVMMIYKHDNQPDEDLLDMRRRLVYNLYNQMLNARLNELRQSPEPPFIFAGTGYGNMVRTKSNYSSIAYVGETEIEKGLKALVRENERVKQFGFSAGELERAKKTYLNNLQKALKEDEKTESASYVNEYVGNFLENEPIPGIKFEYEFANEVFPSVELSELNELAPKWITDYNRVIIITGPEKEGLQMPDEEQVLKWIKATENESIEPYDDAIAGAELITSLPKAGKVTGEKVIEEVGVTEWTLSNGARVVLKPTDFKNDQILFSAFSYGGHSLYSDEDFQSASSASQIINQSGVSEFSPKDLNKLLAGKTVSVSPYIGTMSEGMRGGSSPKDLETMLQLTHLYFTNPKKDEGAFQSYKTRSLMLFQNIMSNPQYYYQDQIARILSQDHPRADRFPTPEDMGAINFERVFEIYKERFADAGDFTFLFVGAFEIDNLKPLVEKYIGSLPSSGSKENWKDLGIVPPAGKVDEVIKKGTDPKSLVNIYFTGETDYSKEANYYIKSLGEVLSNKLIDVIREEKSGVYGVGANGSISKYPKPRYTFSISFPCGPENLDELVQATLEVVEQVKQDGITEEELNEVKEAQRINRQEGLKQNQYWLNTLQGTYYYQGDITNYYETEELMKALSTSDILQTAKKYLDTDNMIKIVLVPEQ